MTLVTLARRSGRIVLCASALLGMPEALPVRAQDTQGAPPRHVIEEVVREYILAHPEVIVESLRAMEQRQRESQRQRARDVIVARRDELLADPASPVGGNAQGDVTIVEFFDYRCPYCKSMAGMITQLVKDDPKVRLVYKEWPILGEDSFLAARAALASHAQGRYVPFHEALMAASGPFTPEKVFQIAADTGLDAAKLRVDMEKPEIVAAIRKTYALAQALGLNGTPAFVVGSELVPRTLDQDELTRLVAQARRQVGP